MPGRQQANLHESESSKRSPRQDAAEARVASHPLVRIQASIGNAALARLMAQRQETPEEEEMQLLREPLAQRQTEEEEDDMQMLRDPLAQRQPEEEEEEMQMLRNDSSPAAPAVGLEGGPLSDEVSRQIESARGGGSALGDGTRARMESALGADFSGVRVHQDSASDSLARGMTARAFTTGNDVFLRGDVSPGDTSVLAHELTHVVQQSSGRVQTGGDGMTVTAAGDTHEREAEEVAAAVNAGAAPAVEEDAAS